MSSTEVKVMLGLLVFYLLIDPLVALFMLIVFVVWGGYRSGN